MDDETAFIRRMLKGLEPTPANLIRVVASPEFQARFPNACVKKLVAIELSDKRVIPMAMWTTRLEPDDIEAATHLMELRLPLWPSVILVVAMAIGFWLEGVRAFLSLAIGASAAMAVLSAYALWRNRKRRA